MMAQTDKIIGSRRRGGTVYRAAGWVMLSIFFSHVDLLWADEFQVDLQIQQGKQKVQATSKLPISEPTKEGGDKPSEIVSRLRQKQGDKPRPLPVLHIHADQTVWVGWQVTETESSEKFKDLLVHVFAIQEAKTGQQTVPKLSELAAYESALTMDFTPKDQAQGRFQLKFEQSGSYLVRVETMGLADLLGHEFFAAVDVEVDRAAMIGP